VSRQAVEATAAALRAAHGMKVDVHSVPGKGHAMPQVRSAPNSADPPPPASLPATSCTAVCFASA
jgi:biotin operon repressor